MEIDAPAVVGQCAFMRTYLMHLFFRCYFFTQCIHTSRPKEIKKSWAVFRVTMILTSPIMALVIAGCLITNRYHPGMFTQNSVPSFLVTVAFVFSSWLAMTLLDRVFRKVTIPSDIEIVYGTPAQTILHFAELGFGLLCILISALVF